MTIFDKFSAELISNLKSVFTLLKKYRAKRMKFWSEFHQLRIKKLPKLWTDFLSAMCIETDDQLLQQSVNQRAFEMFLPEQFSSQSCTHRASTDNYSLNKDELNALQYAGGYVPHALFKKYEKFHGKKFEEFIQCLGDMSVESECSDFFEYYR